MDGEARDRFPFNAVPRLDSGLWGVWDRSHWQWTAPPELEKAAAERMAKAMIEAYAAGYAEGVIATVRSPAGRRPFPR